MIDPTKEQDVSFQIGCATEMQSVDIAIEVSGSYATLYQAIWGTRYGGTIVPVSWYHVVATDLNLGEEWHFNRQTMV